MVNVGLYIEDTTVAESNPTINCSARRTDLCSNNPFVHTVYGYLSTLDHNRCVLDDKTETYYGGYGAGYWTNIKSNSDCTYTTTPFYRFAFHESHSCKGITIFYLNAWSKAHKVKIYWAKSGVTISEKTFITPYNEDDSINYCFYENEVSGFDTLRIEFLESWLPDQCVTFNYIVFGEVISFANDNIVRANVQYITKDVNDTLEIGTAEVQILDEDGRFNPNNPGGLWERLGELQTVSAECVEDGKIVSSTVWYLDKFKWDTSILTLNLIDLMGLADKKSFPGAYYKNISYRTLISNIANSAKIKISTFADIANANINIAWIPTCTVREALQKISVALGLQIYANAENRAIFPVVSNEEIKGYIGQNRKISTETSFEPVYNGVMMTLPTNVINESTASQIVSQTFPVGRHRVYYNGYNNSSISVSGATLVSAKTFYCDINVATEGTVTITGIKLSLENVNFTKAINDNEDLDTYVKFDNVGIYCEELLDSTLQTFVNHYSRRQRIKSKIIYQGDAYHARKDNFSDFPGKWYRIQSSQDENMFAYARIDKMTLNLVSGIADIECSGFSQITNDEEQMGVDDYTMGDLVLV